MSPTFDQFPNSFKCADIFKVFKTSGHPDVLRFPIYKTVTTKTKLTLTSTITTNLSDLEQKGQNVCHLRTAVLYINSAE